MQTRDRKHQLRTIEILRDLPDDELGRLAELCVWGQYAPGREILAHLDASNNAHFLVAGRARVVIHSAAGKAVLLSDIEAGGVFGELAAIDGQPRSASVEAIDTCIVATLSAPELMRLMQRQSSVAIALLQSLVTDVRRLDQRVLEFSTMTVRERVLAELLRIGADLAQGADQVTISPAPSLSELSSRISTHREAVSRELSRLAQLGIVQRQGGDLVILSLRRLSELVTPVDQI